MVDTMRRSMGSGVTGRFYALPATLDDAHAEIQFLRSELAQSIANDRVARLAKALTVKPSVARLIMALYDTRRVLSKVHLYELMDHQRDGDTFAIVDVYICHARRALGRDAITTHHSFGYSLTPAGRAAIERLSA